MGEAPAIDIADALEADVQLADDMGIADAAATPDAAVDARTEEGPCVTPTVGDPSRVNFFKPDHIEPNWPVTREFYIDRNPEPPFRSVYFALAPYLEPNPGAVEVGYMADGEDLLASVMVANFLDSLPEHRVYISVLKDYQPVEATYTRWLNDRGDESVETRATGIMIEDVQNIELVDIRIKNEQFALGGNEMALMVRSGRPNRLAFNSMRRFTIFHDEFSWPEPPCFATDRRIALTELEESIVTHIDFAAQDDLLKPSATATREEIHNEVEVACGETVPVDVTIINDATPGQRYSSAVFMNGIPLSHNWHYIPVEFDFRSGFMRDRVGIRMPDVPGRYDVFLQRWVESYETFKEPWSIDSESSWNIDGSNLLRFRVMCPQ